MITPKQIERVTMTPEKKAMAHNDYFAFYIGRPISYVLTIPFLYTRLTPNQVTVMSIIPLIVGFILMYVGTSTRTFLCGWFCFFLWNLLDGVDGNMARFRKQFSRMGSVWDAMVGYIAMVLSPFAWGIAAAHVEDGIISNLFPLNPDIYIILGALSGIYVIFPRFIMHKTMTTLGLEENVPSVKDKEHYSPLKIIGLNLISVTGFMQVIMLISIFLNAFDFFTILYFFLNGGVMIASLVSIFKER